MAKKSSTKKGKRKASKKGKKSRPLEGVKIEITVLKKAPESKEFILATGQKLEDLRELAFALGEMADDVFWHHVNEAKNDFACWIDSVFKDNELAEEMRKMRDKINAQLAVLKHIVRKI